MKKIILVGLLTLTSSPIMLAQKHAPQIHRQVTRPGIYPESSTRLLRLSDIQDLNSWDLKIMRNEIFARHGYIFQTQDMIDYFYQQSWYSPKYEDVAILLTIIEKKNISFIKKYE